MSKSRNILNLFVPVLKIHLTANTLLQINQFIRVTTLVVTAVEGRQLLSTDKDIVFLTTIYNILHRYLLDPQKMEGSSRYWSCENLLNNHSHTGQFPTSPMVENFFVAYDRGTFTIHKELSNFALSKWIFWMAQYARNNSSLRRWIATMSPINQPSNILGVHLTWEYRIEISPNLPGLNTVPVAG